jgi:hypothetical protein
MDTVSNHLRWLMIPLLLLVFAVSARWLNADPVWADEFFSIRDAAGSLERPLPPWEVWHDLGVRNPWHVPGFFLLLNGWGRAVGWTPFALRALSLLVGLLAVAFTYRLGRDFISAKAGLFAAVVLGSSAFFIYYLHELRMYTLFALFTVLTLWAYLTLVHRSGGRSVKDIASGRGVQDAGSGRGIPQGDFALPRPYVWGIYAALLGGAVGLLYTHYFAALPLVAIGVYHALYGLVIWRKQQAESVRGWLAVSGTLLLAGLLFLPWLSVLLEGLSRAAAAEELHARALDAGEAVSKLLFLFGNGSPLLLVLAGIGIVLALRGQGVRRLLFFTVAVIAAGLVANGVLQLMHGGRLRYLMSALPLLALLAGAGLARWRRVGWLLLAAWLIGGINAVGQPDFVDIDGGATRYPSQQVAAAIRADAWASDLVVNFTQNFPGYFPGAGEIDFGTLPVSYAFIGGDESLFVRHMVIDDNPLDEPTLDALWTHDRLWVASVPENLPAAYDTFAATLRESYQFCRAAAAPAMQVELYARSPVCCLNDESAALLRFGEGITLNGVDVPASAAGVLPVSLLWTVTGGVAPHAYSVSLQILDTAGAKVAQADYGLAAQLHTCQRAEVDISALPPGTYTVHATVYAWETGERLPGVVIASGATGDLLPVGGFEIRVE